jgi:hypothetical protein
MVEGEEGGAGGEPPGAWRVKLYRLNDVGAWEDQGTGHARVEFVEARLAC